MLGISRYVNIIPGNHFQHELIFVRANKTKITLPRQDVSHLIIGVIMNFLELGEHLGKTRNVFMKHNHIAGGVACFTLQGFETIIDNIEQRLFFSIIQHRFFQ